MPNIEAKPIETATEIVSAKHSTIVQTITMLMTSPHAIHFV